MRLACVARIKHAILLDAVERYGSQRAVAEALGVQASWFGEILHCQIVPSRRWMQRNEDRIFKVFGHLPDDIWPESFRQSAWRGTKKPIRRDVTVSDAQLLSWESGAVKQLTAEIDPEQEAERNQIKRLVQQAIQQLTPREERVLTEYYGLNGDQPKTFQEIGLDLEVCHGRVQQIHANALQKLRKRANYRSGNKLRAALEMSALTA